MNIQEMEVEIAKHYDPIVLSFIKDKCYKSVYSHTEITELEKTEIGIKYRSRMIYKIILDENLYFAKVRDCYKTIEKQHSKKRAKPEIGYHVTQREAFEILFRDTFNRNTQHKDNKGKNKLNHVFLLNVDEETGTFTRPKVVTNLGDFLNKARGFNYFTPNLFFADFSHTKDMLRHLVAIVLDFDLDKHHRVYTKEELHDYIKAKLGIAPALIWDTKTEGNYQCAILIKPMSGTDKSVHLYEQIVKEMIYKLEIADEACTDANHKFSVMRSNGKRKIRCYNRDVHDIDDFRWLLDERDKRREQQLNNSNVVEFTSVAVRKHPAIDALFNAEIVSGRRNNGCFTLALVMRFLGHSEDQCEQFIVTEWYPKVRKRDIDGKVFSKSEMHQCIKHAYSGNYKSFKSTYVEMVTGIDCELRGYFRTRYESQGIYMTKNKQRVIEFLEQRDGLFEGQIEEIAVAIGANKRTLERTMRELRKEGVITYATAQGRGKQTVFVLEGYQQEAVFTIDREKGFEIEMICFDEMPEVHAS